MNESSICRELKEFVYVRQIFISRNTDFASPLVLMFELSGRYNHLTYIFSAKTLWRFSVQSSIVFVTQYSMKYVKKHNKFYVF